MVRREFLKSKWDPVFDNKPTSDIPRMKFCETFSKEFFKKEYLVLDVGCGTGSYTQIIDGDNCVAMDLDMNALKIAKQFCTKSISLLRQHLTYHLEIIHSTLCLCGRLWKPCQ